MQWAIVNLIDMEIFIGNNDTGELETVIASPGTIVNMVVYDEEKSSEWQPPEGTKLVQVDDTAKIGDTGFL